MAAMRRTQFAILLFAAVCLVALYHQSRSLKYTLMHPVHREESTTALERRLAGFARAIPTGARVGYVGDPTTAAQAKFVLAPRVVIASGDAPWVIVDLHGDVPASLAASLERVARGPDGLTLWRRRR